MSDSLRIAVLGAGRMGQELIHAVNAAEGLHLAGVWTRRDRRLAAAGIEFDEQTVVGNDLPAVLQQADVAVDFSLPEAAAEILEAVANAAKPLVCGVTGLDDALLQRMQAVATSLPVFYDRNMSFGIAVLKDLVCRAGALLGTEFQAGIHESHHVHKRDAPSGTALKLGEALAAVRHQDFSSVFRYAQDGVAARTSPDDIVFTATREGEIPGEHSVFFQSEAEILELTHRVTDRRVFANGALRAACWLVSQQPGLYRMSDLAKNPL